MPSLLESLDKSGWKTYRFDEIARNISERVEPGTTDLTVYVGLEHIDSGSLHIKRTGTPADVEGTKLRVYAGDVIFGRRRAYQRKAAVATVDGICSAHALVLRAKPEVIDPRLFPFFLHSDAFMHRAVDISVGGLSPTINWGNLKTETFLLPPRDQQARLAELLWAADEVGEKYTDIQTSSLIVESALFESYAQAENVDKIHLKDIVTKPISYGIVQAGPEFPGGMPYIKSSDLNNEEIDSASLSRTSATIAHKYRRSEVEPGDIVFSLRGNLGTVRVVPDTLPRANLTQGTARISVDNQLVSTDYVLIALGSSAIRKQINSVQKGSTFQEVSLDALRNLTIPLLGAGEQRKVIGEYQAVRQSAKQIGILKSNHRLLQQALINQIFAA